MKRCLSISASWTVVLSFASSASSSLVSSAWSSLGPSTHEEPLRLSFALKQQNLDVLEETFWQVSDPQSSSYGQFKTFEEIKALVAPDSRAVEDVLAFFAELGTPATLNPGGDYIDVEISAGKAATLLSADIQAYKSKKNGLVYHRALGGFVLPDALAKHVDHAFPLKQLPAVLRKRSTKVFKSDPMDETPTSSSDWPKDCTGLTKDGMITPGVIRKRYNVTMPTSPRKGSIAVALGYDPDDGCGFIQSDIEERNKLCGIEGDTVQVEVKGDGKSKYCPNSCKKNIGDSCGESNLDVQTSTAIAAGVPAQFWIIKSGDPLDVFKQINEDRNSAMVVSCSFGDSEAQYDEDGGKKLETELKKAGVAGKTVIFASGDNGVWAPPDALGMSTPHKKFSVGYPQSSAYVTAVGGSQFIPRAGGDKGGDVIGSEMGVETGLDYGDTWVTSGSSGGGISNLFKAPSYQAAAVSSWYSSAKAAGTLPTSSKWANTGSNRGYPDVAVLAGLPGEGKATKDGSCTGECANYYLRQAGYWTHADGTSASAPAFAGMIAVINEHRLASGKPPMGAVNTFLYQNAHAFDDITKGDNKYFGNGKDYGGFLAADGWDPVTGLGAPNVGMLVHEALAAVNKIVSV